MSRAAFQLVYDGPALLDNQMSAKQLANALMAFDTLLSEADRVLNGGKTETRLNVKASFKTGSFKIDFSSFSNVVDRLKDALLAEETAAILNAHAIVGLTLGALFALKKWLDGRRIERLELNDGRVKVWVGDKFLEVERKAITLFENHLIQKALQEAVAEPLNREGVDSFGVIVDGKVITDVSKDEAHSFIATDISEVELQDQTVEKHLNLISPSFREGDKWRVSDGISSFFAEIRDNEFIEKMLKGEVEFGASNTLRVKLRTVQSQDETGKLSSKAYIEKVIDVIKPPEQQRLL